MSDIRNYTSLVDQIDRMQRHHIAYNVTGDTVVLTGIAHIKDRERFEFQNIDALTNFLDGYIAGINYQES